MRRMRRLKFVSILVLAVLVLSSSMQVVQSQITDVYFAAVYEMEWAPSDESTDGEVWVSIHRSDGTVTDIQVTDTSEDESDPSIAIAPNGNIIVAWEVVGLYYAVYDRWGNIIKMPTVLSSQLLDRDSCVAVTPNNVVFVVWESTRPGDGIDDVAYVTMNVDGENVSPERRISGVEGDISDPTVAASTKNGADNRVVLAWEDFDGENDQVAFTILDSSGNTLVSKRALTDTTEENEDVNAAILPNGNTVIVWEGNWEETSGDDVGYAIIDSSGTPVVPVTFISRPTDIDGPGVAATPSGNIVIVWDEMEGEFGPDDVMFTILDGMGNTVVSITKLADSTSTSRRGHSSSEQVHYAGSLPSSGRPSGCGHSRPSSQ